MLVYFLNIIIILLISCLFSIIGYNVNKYIFKINQFYNIPIGFFTFMGFFQLINLLFMIKHSSFIPVLLFNLLLIILIFLILLWKSGKEWINDLIKKCKNEYFKIFLIITMIFGSYLFIFATSSGDAWLFAPMTISCIDNNLIFSNNGVNVNGVIQSFHGYESYYLLQAILAKISGIDPYVYINSFFKLLEAIIISSGIAFMVSNFFKNNRIYYYILIILTYIMGKSFFTSYPLHNEIDLHTFFTMPIGINLINILFAVCWYIYLYKAKKSFGIILLVLGSFALSSSTLFISVAFLIVSILNDIFFLKITRNFNDYFIIFVIIIFYFFLYFIFPNYLWIGFIFLFFILSLVYVIYQMLMKLNVEELLQILKKTFIVISIIALIIFSIQPEAIKGILNIYNLSSPSENMQNYYFNPFSNIIILIITVTGVYQIYQEDKKLLGFICIGTFVFANPISYVLFTKIIPQVVYHRLYGVILIPIIISYGVKFLIIVIGEKLNLNSKKILFLIIIILFITNPFTLTRKINNYDSFAQFKYINKDLYELRSFDFAKSKNVDLGVEVNKYLTQNHTLNQLFQIRGDLNWVYNTNKDYYKIVPREEVIDSLIEFQTENYNVIFIKGESNE